MIKIKLGKIKFIITQTNENAVITTLNNCLFKTSAK
jgi:hypothetical protein